MKKKLYSLLAAVLILPSVLSAQTDYEKIMANLDHGGISLNYTDASVLVRCGTELFTAIFAPAMNTGANQAGTADIAKIVEICLQEFDMQSFRGMGESIKETSPGLYTVKACITTDAAMELFVPDAEKIMAFAPEKTAAAFAVSINGAVMSKKIGNILNVIPDNQFKETLQTIQMAAQMYGIDLKAAFNSMTGIALFYEVDEARQVLPGFTSLTLVLRMKDRTFFQSLMAVAQNMAGPESVSNGRISISTPQGIQITGVQKGDFLFISTDSMLDARIAGNAKSLLDSPEFQKISEGMAEHYYSAFYCSADLGKQIINSPFAAAGQTAGIAIDIPKIVKELGLDKTSYGIGTTDRKGMYTEHVRTGSLPLALVYGSPVAQCWVAQISEICRIFALQGIGYEQMTECGLPSDDFAEDTIDNTDDDGKAGKVEKTPKAD